MKNAFTMLEMIFVIVVIGILSAIAIPKFAATRDDAHVAKARSTVASIRSGLATQRTNRIMRGLDPFPEHLDDGGTAAGEELFDNVLDYPVRSSGDSGHWIKTGDDTYRFNTTNTIFTYDSDEGTFDCDHDKPECSSNFEF